ncbi:unnamed protein product, partial [Prorocentrum cordatum]
MKRPAAAPPVHAAKSRRRAAGPALAGRASRSGDATMDGGGAVAAAVAAIPSGRTRTKMEVFRSALELMGRGDEAIGTGTRTGLAGARCAGWHRVVASDGGFWESRAAAHAQLRALRREGARPQLGEEARLHLKGRCQARRVLQASATRKSTLLLEWLLVRALWGSPIAECGARAAACALLVCRPPPRPLA